MGQRKALVGVEGQAATWRRKLLGKVAALYHQEFLTAPQGRAALEAVGVTGSTLWTDFKIGYVNGALLKLTPEGSEAREGLKALGVLTSDGQETLAGCVVVPWFGEGGECVGMAGVKCETSEEVYVPQEPQGVWNAPAARRSRPLILTDSILKALKLYQAGMRDVVPVWGKGGLTQDHRALFQRCGVKEVVLAFEPGPGVLEGLKEEEIQTRVVGWDELWEGLDAGVVERTATGFTAKYGARMYRVKGIEKGPVKLKASLQAYKAGQEGRFHLDVVDMYSQRGRNLFAKGANALLGESEETILGDLGKLIPLAEQFTAQAEGPKVPDMTPEDQAEAIAFLKDPNLLGRIQEDFERCGLSGEGANKLTGYLAAVSRKLEDPLAVLIQSRSAAGKSTLQEAILRFVPPEDYVKYTRLTGQALFYVDETGLCHKLIAIEEEAGAREASYSIRNLQSSKALSIATTEKDGTTGKMRTVEYRVKGPVALMLTTTSVDMDYETQNRFLTLTIDESKGMTERILQNQREGETLEGLRKGRERERIERRHQNAQRLLKPLSVVNPYAPKLAFPATTLRARRDHKKYLGLIRAIAFLHQYQREVKNYTPGEGEEPVAYVEVVPEDIERANALAGEVLGRTLDEVSAPGRALLGEIRKQAGKAKEIRFTRRQIREACGWSDFQVKTHLGELVELEYLYVAEGRKGKEYVYELAGGLNGAEEAGEPRLAGLVGVAGTP